MEPHLPASRPARAVVSSTARANVWPQRRVEPSGRHTRMSVMSLRRSRSTASPPPPPRLLLWSPIAWTLQVSSARVGASPVVRWEGLLDGDAEADVAAPDHRLAVAAGLGQGEGGAERYVQRLAALEMADLRQVEALRVGPVGPCGPGTATVSPAGPCGPRAPCGPVAPGCPSLPALPAAPGRARIPLELREHARLLIWLAEPTTHCEVAKAAEATASTAIPKSNGTMTFLAGPN